MSTAIEYGVPTDRCGIQLRLGAEKGFFRDEGIDLNVRIVFGGPEIAAEFDSGHLPVGELGTPPGLTALAKGARFKIIGSGIRRGAVQYFVAHTRFSSWSDLSGANLGVLSRGSCSDWYMREVLKHHEIDSENFVTIRSLGTRYPEVLRMFAEGELDGAIISEPHVTLGEDAGLFKVWLGMNNVDLCRACNGPLPSQMMMCCSASRIWSRRCCVAVSEATAMPPKTAMNGPTLALTISVSHAKR
jgi:ABC-type nitrate/sulfonate/bicarbonate transport system substrate-binding protein